METKTAKQINVLKRFTLGLALAVCISGFCSQAIAADEPAQATDAAKAGEPAKKEKGKLSLTKIAPGVTPVSDYSGDIWHRSTLTGDWWGNRQDLYEHGVMFDVALTQVLQGVVSGGTENSIGAHYNALLDYGVSFDTGKLDLWPGGLIVANAQTSWGEPLQTEPGNISPVNMTAIYPIPFEETTVLSEYYLIQPFPNKMVLTLGRLNATDFVDKNRFANEPRNQFLNLSLNNNMLWGYFLSFSTYAALLEIPLTKDFGIGFAAWDPETQPGDYGGVWDNIGAAGIVDYKWKLGKGLGGTANLVFAYSSKDTDAIDNPRFVPGLITGNVPTKPDNWMVCLDFEQYVWKPKKATGGRAEVRTRSFDYQEPGVGVFLRAGYTPDDRNLWNTEISLGVSGRGIIPGRPYDRMGIGAYTFIESDDLKDRAIIGDALDSEFGLEAFYNYAITPWLQLSGDVQWIDPGIKSNDDVWVLGTRLFIQF